LRSDFLFNFALAVIEPLALSDTLEFRELVPLASDPEVFDPVSQLLSF
jgi:hypothetical protein